MRAIYFFLFFIFLIFLIFFLKGNINKSEKEKKIKKEISLVEDSKDEQEELSFNLLKGVIALFSLMVVFIECLKSLKNFSPPEWIELDEFLDI